MKRLMVLALLAAPLLAQTPAQTPSKSAPTQGPPPKNLTVHPDGRYSANGDPANPDKFEVRTVVVGDTLSAIAGDVLKDSHLWPQLWEQNEHIVNPHWIYPKDQLLIRPVVKITEAEPPPPPVVEVTPAPAPAPVEAAELAPPYVPTPVRVQYPGPGLRANLAPEPPRAGKDVLELNPPKVAPEVKASDLACSGFIRTTPVTQDLKVASKASNDGSVLASSTDYVYLNQGASRGIQVGATYNIVRPTRIIDNPAARGAQLGMHYLEIAQVRVVTAQPDFAMARVTFGCDAIELGDFMVPYQTAAFPPLPRPRSFSPTMKSSGTPSGAVVSTKNVLANAGTLFKGTTILPGTHEAKVAGVERGIASQGEVVYLAMGASSGVKPGDIFIVYRDSAVDAELFEIRKGEAPHKEHRAIGELVILKAEEKAATALVTYAVVGISQGDVAEKR